MKKSRLLCCVLALAAITDGHARARPFHQNGLVTGPLASAINTSDDRAPVFNITNTTNTTAPPVSEYYFSSTTRGLFLAYGGWVAIAMLRHMYYHRRELQRQQNVVAAVARRLMPARPGASEFQVREQVRNHVFASAALYNGAGESEVLAAALRPLPAWAGEEEEALLQADALAAPAGAMQAAVRMAAPVALPPIAQLAPLVPPMPQLPQLPQMMPPAVQLAGLLQGPAIPAGGAQRNARRSRLLQIVVMHMPEEVDDNEPGAGPGDNFAPPEYKEDENAYLLDQHKERIRDHKNRPHEE